MRLSTKGRYGLRAMLDLAIHGSEGPVSLKTIAERQELSENYLEQLFATLKKSQFVKSIRGAQGGYELNRDIHDITVGEILRSLEGSLAPVDCVDENGEATQCSRYDNCITRDLWEKIRDSIDDVVDNITLGYLTEQYNKGKEF